MERNTQIIAAEEVTALSCLPAFHANEGATGLRHLYLEQMGLRCCYSFENRRRLFEIHLSYKFDLIVASRRGPTDKFGCAFYLHDDNWLFGDIEVERLVYTLRFTKQIGGEHLNLLELRSRDDVQVAEKCFTSGEPFGKVCASLGIHLGRELHMTDDAWRLTPAAAVVPDGNNPGIRW